MYIWYKVIIVESIKFNCINRFFASTAVFLAELLKLLFEIAIIYFQSKSCIEFYKTIKERIFGNITDILYLCLPAFLYSIQNNLLYIGNKNLPSTIYQVIYQAKIISTALMSVLLLNKKLHIIQWFSLFLLFIGVVIVMPKKNDVLNDEMNPYKGLLAVSLACITSGLAGVSFEKIIKSSTYKLNIFSESITIRNLQLSIPNTIFSFIVMIIVDGENIKEYGFFYHYVIYVLKIYII